MGYLHKHSVNLQIKRIKPYPRYIRGQIHLKTLKRQSALTYLINLSAQYLTTLPKFGASIKQKKLNKYI